MLYANILVLAWSFSSIYFLVLVCWLSNEIKLLIKLLTISSDSSFVIQIFLKTIHMIVDNLNGRLC